MKSILIISYPHNWNDDIILTFPTRGEAEDYARDRRSQRTAPPGTENYCKITLYVIAEEVSF